MFILCMLRESIIIRISSARSNYRDIWETYAGARVVFRKVDLQIVHWMSFACSF